MDEHGSWLGDLRWWYPYRRLTLPGDPTLALHAATKQYVDNRGGAKIVTGTYSGHNQSGASNPNSLTFDFVPKMLILWVPNGTWQYNTIINLTSAKETYGRPSPVITNIDSDDNLGEYYHNEDSNFNFKVVGTTVYWYHNTSRRHQFSFSGTTAYMAIG